MKAKAALILLLLARLGFSSSIPVYSLPMTCSELIPEHEPFIAFFEATAKGSVISDKPLAKRIFRILSLRNKINDTPDKIRDQNPVDLLIRKTLCFYREQKEPLKPVPFDDQSYLHFLKGALVELETKVKYAVFDTEFLRASKKQYESKMKENEEIVDKMRLQAEIDAQTEYEKVIKEAQKKVGK